MKLLHVYAGPFPTSQGTQALINQTCTLLARHGHEVHLLCYAGRQFDRQAEFTIHRIPDRPRFHQLRSGPRWQKPLLDVVLGAYAMRLARELRPDVIAGHHVEALLASRAAASRLRIPLVYHLHALLAPELPTYFPGALGPASSLAGRLADRLCCSLADHTVALSTAQARSAGIDGLSVVHPALDPSDLLAEAATAADDEAAVRGVYVGNLDGYQNIRCLIDSLKTALPQMGGRLQFEFITDSDPAPVQREFSALGIDGHVSFTPHGDYSAAREKLLRADFTVIPRVQVGGVPIKLVTALTLGLPTILHHELSEGLAHETEALLVDMASPEGVADAICSLAQDARLRANLTRGARSAVRRLFDPGQVAEKLGQIYESCCLCA